MVCIFKNTHTYLYPWNVVTTAFWLKYPNILNPNVIEVDTYDRYIDKQGCLRSYRLITCQNSLLPNFMTTLGVPSRIFIAEESIVDPKNKSMIIKSKNVSGTSFMTVEETCIYEKHDKNKDWTSYRQTAHITTSVPLFREQIEQHCVDHLSKTSNNGLEIIEKICKNISCYNFD